MNGVQTCALPILELNIKNDPNYGIIIISTEPGRALRPLIIVDNGISRLTMEHLIKLEQNEMAWGDLIKEKIIEYRSEERRAGK